MGYRVASFMKQHRFSASLAVGWLIGSGAGLLFYWVSLSWLSGVLWSPLIDLVRHAPCCSDEPLVLFIYPFLDGLLLGLFLGLGQLWAARRAKLRFWMFISIPSWIIALVVHEFTNATQGTSLVAIQYPNLAVIIVSGSVFGLIQSLALIKRSPWLKVIWAVSSLLGFIIYNQIWFVLGVQWAEYDEGYLLGWLPLLLLTSLAAGWLNEEVR